MLTYSRVDHLPPSTEVFKLLADCFSTYEDESALKARVTPLLEATDNYFFIAQDQQKTVGILIVKKIETNFLIEALVVAEAFRHQHIASKLIKLLIDKLQPFQITLETDDDALHFYQKNQFVILQTEVKYQNCSRYTLVWQAAKNTPQF